MAKKGKKRGVQKSENLEDKRSFFVKIKKSFFIIISKSYFDGKNKNVDTSQ